jgi:rubrerythrin
MAKEPLYPHVPGGKLPPSVTSPASLRKYAMSSDLRNSLNLQLIDEEKGISEYDTLIARARNMGLNEVAQKLGDIGNDERKHRQMLLDIIAESWKG